MRKLLKITTALGLFFSLLNSPYAAPNTVFEGYYRILAGDKLDKHVGFIVHRYRFNEKLKRFQSTYYLRTNALAGDITESLDAYANEKFHPISYQFTQTIGNRIKLIDAKFSGHKMTATVSNGKTSETINRQYPKGVFLSTFLAYLMLQQGMVTDKRYSYKGIAEEDASAQTGDAYIKEKMVQYKGQEVFKILNEFKQSKFISFVNPKGEIYATHSPAQRISTELVLNPSEATAGFKFQTEHLRKLFGEVPLGQKNSIANPMGTANKVDNIPPKGKGGIAPGNGIVVKGGGEDKPVPIGQPKSGKGK